MTVDDPGSLLSAPLSSSVRAEVRYPRCSASYENLGTKFNLGRKDYNRQFFHVYSSRLAKMREMVLKHAKKQFGKDTMIKKLTELKEDDDGKRQEDIIIVGTLFKQQQLKPSVLDELKDDAGMEPQPPHTKYIHEEDKLILEDEGMRVRLEGAFNPAELVNGVVAGCLGREVDGGKFEVKKMCFAILPEEEVKGEIPEDDCLVAFISGLELYGEGVTWLGQAQLAVDWLVGAAGGVADQEGVARVERVVLVGDSLAESTRNKDEQNKAAYLTKGNKAGSIEAVAQLDDLLVQLAGSLNTDLMPGPNDPATAMMPQQPLHKCMFPQASRYPTMQSVTNPYTCQLAGRRILATSGQTVQDVMRNTDMTDPLDAMAACLKWGHVAPTCPDTLGCYPYHQDDPFILDHLPDIFVAGNQAKFQKRADEINGKRVVMVALPRFSSTKSVVTMNLKDLECSVLAFDTSLDADWLEEPESPEPQK